MSKSLRTSLLFLVTLLVALAAPAAANALTVDIDNQSGLLGNEVFVNVSGEAETFDVPGFENNVPVALSSIDNGQITINKLVSGRIYISYQQGVLMSVPFNSATRFDWAELTVIPSSSDVANLTAVDQFGIGMRLETFTSGGSKLEELGTANSDRIFTALGQIPGGAAATVKDPAGDVLRVLSPLHSTYPNLTQYVQSLAGQTITLSTAFFGAPFTTSSYSGSFAADGSVTLTGATNPPGAAPATLSFPGSQLMSDIYTGGNTPNNMSGAIYRDILAGFSTGMWGGKYGYNALGFCSNPVTTGQGSWCPGGFNKPAFGDARAKLETYATCEQYAAVINQYSDSYGNPYSDAAKKTTVSINQPATGGSVAKLVLTVLPDQGNAAPVNSGNPNCGAASSLPPKAKFEVKLKAFKKAVVKNNRARVGTIICSGSCGQIQTQVRAGKKFLGKGYQRSQTKKVALLVNLKPGQKFLKARKKVKTQLKVVIVHGGKRYIRQGKTLLLKR